MVHPTVLTVSRSALKSDPRYKPLKRFEDQSFNTAPRLKSWVEKFGLPHVF